MTLIGYYLVRMRAYARLMFTSLEYVDKVVIAPAGLATVRTFWCVVFEPHVVKGRNCEGVLRWSDAQDLQDLEPGKKILMLRDPHAYVSNMGGVLAEGEVIKWIET